jgi:hypothetical protein
VRKHYISAQPEESKDMTWRLKNIEFDANKSVERAP